MTAKKTGRPTILDDSEKRAALIEALETTGDMVASCRAIDVDYKTVIRYRQSHPEFDAEVRTALAYGKKESLPAKLFQSAVERATRGAIVPVYRTRGAVVDKPASDEEVIESAWNGQNVLYYKQLAPSDFLMKELLRAYLPEFRKEAPAVTTNIGAPGEGAHLLEDITQSIYKELMARRVSGDEAIDIKKIRTRVHEMFIKGETPKSFETEDFGDLVN